MKKILILLIRIFQWTISPFLGESCRFYPSCSDYCIEAFTKYGTFKGFLLSFKRVVKCGPWHPGGYDPTP